MLRATTLCTAAAAAAALQIPPSRPADYRFEHTVRSPIGNVLAFYERDDILKVLTPPVVSLKTVEKEPIEENSVNSFVLRPPFLAEIPWVARHYNVDRTPTSLEFVDVQEKGPMKLWHHKHQISGDMTSTTIVDTLWVEHPENGKLLSYLLFGPPALYALFTYRSIITRFYV